MDKFNLREFLNKEIDENNRSYITAFHDYSKNEPEDPSIKQGLDKALDSFKEDLRVLLSKYSGKFENSDFLVGVKQQMNNWLPILRSVLNK